MDHGGNMNELVQRKFTLARPPACCAVALPSYAEFGQAGGGYRDVFRLRRSRGDHATIDSGFNSNGRHAKRSDRCDSFAETCKPLRLLVDGNCDQ
jgi:hypothetical protein